VLGLSGLTGAITGSESADDADDQDQDPDPDQDQGRGQGQGKGKGTGNVEGKGGVPELKPPAVAVSDFMSVSARAKKDKELLLNQV